MEQPEGDPAEGLRILARIIARSWVRRQLAKASLEVQSTAVAKSAKPPVATEPVLTP